MRRDNKGKLIFDDIETDPVSTLTHIGTKDELYAIVKKDPDSGKWGVEVFSNRAVASASPIFDTEKDAKGFFKSHVGDISKAK